MLFWGKGVAKGLAKGPAYIISKTGSTFSQTRTEDPERELKTFFRARDEVMEDIQSLAQRYAEQGFQEGTNLMEAYCDILGDDIGIAEPVSILIREQHYNAAMAAAEVFSGLVRVFEEMPDAYFQERATDAREIMQLLLDNLTGNRSATLPKLTEPSVIIARELTPADTAKLDLRKIVGILTEVGGPTGHIAILARNMGIPAIVGIPSLDQCITLGSILLLDGETGSVILDPTERECRDFEEKYRAVQQQEQVYAAYRFRKTITADGMPLKCGANIASAEEPISSYGAEKLGLVRSEFLYLATEELPDEERQFQAYKKILQGIAGDVLIRTLDVGGDKNLPALPMEKEENPFLGQRAIRLCLMKKELFITQLRALLRASAFGRLGIMFPMISTLTELQDAKQCLQEARESLLSEGAIIGNNVQVGMMIEVPSAAILAEEFAREADFFSIGTNDLSQYTYAADRTNTAVAHLNSYYQPATMRLIHHTIKAAKKAGIPCGICGEAAADKIYAPFLLGAGLTEFSMSPSRIPEIRCVLSRLDTAKCGEVTNYVLTLSDEREIFEFLKNFCERNSV